MMLRTEMMGGARPQLVKRDDLYWMGRRTPGGREEPPMKQAVQIW